MEILDKKFTNEEIHEGINKLKINKASGIDSLSNEMIKAGNEILRPYICKLFNAILFSEYYPEMWSIGYIVPIHKKGNVNDPSNYRGITISSCLGKLFALIMNNRLDTYILENQIIPICQIGFIKHKRTSDHFFVLKCIIDEAKLKKKPIFGCFMDLKKAFDTLWIQGLLYKMLCKYQISPRFVRLLNNMYGKLKASVYSNCELEKIFNIAIGTRQGCNLSPSLFNIFTSDLPYILEKNIM